MLQGRRPELARVKTTSQKMRRRRFRLTASSELSQSFSGPMLVLTGLLFLFFAGPICYFSFQNYYIFKKISYDTHPGFIQQLEREQLWLIFLFISGLIMMPALTYWVSKRITRSIFRKLDVIERQLHQMSQGDWESVLNKTAVSKNTKQLKSKNKTKTTRSKQKVLHEFFAVYRQFLIQLNIKINSTPSSERRPIDLVVLNDEAPSKHRAS